MGHLAYRNGQTTKGEHLQCMHTFMRGYKCPRHKAFRPVHLNQAALTYEQGDLKAEKVSTGTSV